MRGGIRLSRDQWLGHLAMLVFAALVAGSFSLGSIVANRIDPQAITTARFVLAAGVMGALAAARGQLKAANFRAPWRFIVLGGLFAFYFVMMFEGLKTAAPVSAAAVFTLIPLMSAGFGWVLLGQATTPRMALALAIAAFGALWVIFRGDMGALAGLELGRGEAIYLLGGVGHALYTPMVRRLNRGESAVAFTFGTLVAGAVLLLAVSGPKLAATDWAALPAIVWVTLGYLVLASTAASFLLLQFATLRLPSAKVMAYSYLTPAVVILWEAALGNGLPPLKVAIGVAATALALVILLKDEEGSRRAT